MTEERRVGQGEVLRRLENIERKLDNGHFLRKDFFEAVIKAMSEDVKDLKQANTWLMRLIVTMALGLVAEAVVLVFKLS